MTVLQDTETTTPVGHSTDRHSTDRHSTDRHSTVGHTTERRAPVATSLVIVMGALTALGPLTIDMYLPSLPAITSDLGASPAAVQFTLTGTLIGLAVGQLLIGPLSDAVGRRRPLIGGVLLHVVASLLCALAPNVAVLAGVRVLQGAGAAAAMVVTMAMVRDVASGTGAARLLSRLMLVVGAAPVLAPTLGGFVLAATSWRGLFMVLAALGAVLTAVAFVLLPETLPAENRRPAGMVRTLRAYGGLFGDRTFVGLVLVAAFAMGAVFAYVSGSSFVFQEQFGLSQQQFALVFGAGSVGLIAATQLNPRLLDRWSPQTVLTGSVVLAVVASLVLLTITLLDVGGLVGVLVPLWAVLFAAGLSLPNAPALALSRHGETAGAAAAMLGAVQFVVGAVSGSVVGALGVSAVAMAVVVAGSAMLGALALVVAVRPRSLVDID